MKTINHQVSSFHPSLSNELAMQIDLVAFLYLLLTVAVFLVYTWNKGKKKRPSLGEEVGFEELTIEQALNEYNPATATAMPPAPVSVTPPTVTLPPRVETTVIDREPTSESRFVDYESQIIESRRNARKKQGNLSYKRLSRKKSLADVKKPFVFNFRDAIMYETIWKKKY